MTLDGRPLALWLFMDGELVECLLLRKKTVIDVTVMWFQTLFVSSEDVEYFKWLNKKQHQALRRSNND